MLRGVRAQGSGALLGCVCVWVAEKVYDSCRNGLRAKDGSYRWFGHDQKKVLRSFATLSASTCVL